MTTTTLLPIEKKISDEKKRYDEVSLSTSVHITKKYSTSFSIGILCLDKSIRNAIYQIYGFVRVADEIVDTFHGYDKEELLNEFEVDTFKSIERGISTNPVLHGFQEVVHKYRIDHELIRSFLYSMRMDLEKKAYDKNSYEQYIYGSAEVVGLMCLYVFVQGDMEQYIQLRPKAMKLGSAFQKINFLRDLKTDSLELGRVYFPNVDLNHFDDKVKEQLIDEIEKEFDIALDGIRQLPIVARFGVYVAYLYYRRLTAKIKSLPAKKLLSERVRVPNFNKFLIILRAYSMKKIGIRI